MLSPSGNAEIPASEEVINDISSVCNLVVGEEKSEKSEQQLNLSLFSRVFQNQDIEKGDMKKRKKTHHHHHHRADKKRVGNSSVSRGREG